MLYILIIQTAFLGDVVLATALIEKIKMNFPSAKIDFLLKKGNENLLKNNPNINQILILDKKNKIKSIVENIKIVRKKKYDKVINIHRHFSSGLIATLSGAKEIIGFDKNPLSFLYTKKVKHSFYNIHEVERNQLLTKHFTDTSLVYPKIYPSKQDKDAVKHLLCKKFITISPGSVWQTKKYPIPQWVKFLDFLEKEEIEIFLLGSKQEIDEGEQIIFQTKNKKVKNFCGKFNLIQSAVLMQKAIMNYTNDSAPTHIASAINAPVATIFCSTSPQYGYGPIGEKAFDIQAEQKLNCHPCTNHGKKKCPLNHFNCANLITQEQLYNVLKKQIW